MSVILGINAFHPDASACLLIDGVLKGAVAEERLGARHKHTMSFPVEAIRWLLSSNGLCIRDVSHVAIARSPFSNIGSKAKYLLRSPKNLVGSVSRYVNRNLSGDSALRHLPELLGDEISAAKYKCYVVEHHLAHIASSYYVSPFECTTSGFSYDGSGDFVSAMAAVCEGPNITVKKKVFLPDSLGHFYTAMCQFIGFDLFGEEYKVMGLAPYGEDNFSEHMKDIIFSDEKYGFRLNHKYFDVSRGLRQAELGDLSHMKLGKIYSDQLIEKFGPPRARGSQITQREKDIARSTQIKFEEMAGSFINSLSRDVPLARVALAGGCALNGVMNARIYRDFPVEQMFIQPAASDDGTAIGAAFHCWHNHLGRAERFEMKHAFWGPEYSDTRILDAIKRCNLKPREANSLEHAAEIAAEMIANGSVLGWYQGRSEWGPRALGNRSILANPAISNMKDIINKKIKKRESFRPFAPSVLAEDVSVYFEQNISSPFMMHVVKFKHEWRKIFPSVVHEDGTGRMQTVDAESNSLYHYLISCVKRHTGYGLVLNTSFNENEPIVDTPEQAISCFLRTDMDALVLGRYVLVKRLS